jgi:hypothetical protein
LPKRGSKVDEHLPSAGHVKKTQINSQHQEFGPKVSKGGAVTAIFDACALVPFGPCAQTTGRRVSVDDVVRGSSGRPSDG